MRSLVLLLIVLTGAASAQAKSALVLQSDFGTKDEVLEGGLAQLDFQYGNVWTNIPDAPGGPPLLYLNSLRDLSLALNQGNFSQKNGVLAGGEWTVCIGRVTR